MKASKLNRVFFLFLLLCFVAAGFISGAYAILNRPAGNETGTVLFTVTRGSSVLGISIDLEKRTLIRSSFFASVLTRIQRYSLKAGTYRISPAMTTSQILAILHEGEQETVRVTIPEGLTIRKTASLLDDAGVVDSADFIRACTNPALIRQFELPGSSVEGFLFPDTYSFLYGMDADTIVEKMVSNFFRKTADLAAMPVDRNTLYNKVILASIVEREYRVAREAPLIASVFSNRLKIGMGLQSCSTVEYIITEIQGSPHPTRLVAEDLEIQSDYNTYLWAGLPPGPISNPGITALAAALDPPRSNYLYFRLTDPVQGTHVFTRSLDEHVDAGRQLYLKRAAGN